MEAHSDRIIGKYKGTSGGPLFICIGAMHGNEPAGVKAIEMVLKMLEVEPIRNPDFIYNGVVVGLIGNRRAFKIGQRYISKDLNRNLRSEKLSELKTTSSLDSEDQEFLELDQIVKALIAEHKPEQVILLDLHTTSSHGGIFTICRDNHQHIDIAASLHAPIVLGILPRLEGTTLHYFTTDNLGVPTVPITFESGQHLELLSINRAVAGIINCMKAVGSVDPDVVENHHEKILIDYSKYLPRVTTLVRRHEISESDGFVMKPGYTNFQQVKKGEVVAEDKNGPLAIQEDGRILMPLYQEQGEDGYFLVKEVL